MWTDDSRTYRRKIAGDFVPGRIRTQENSYPFMIGYEFSWVRILPGTKSPDTRRMRVEVEEVNLGRLHLVPKFVQ